MFPQHTESNTEEMVPKSWVSDPFTRLHLSILSSPFEN